MRYYMAMGAAIVLVLCAGLTLLVHGLYRAYFYFPARELKRRAAHGKRVYRALRQVMHYEATARVFLQGLVFVFGAATVIMICRSVEPLTALILLGLFALALRFTGDKYAKRLINLAASIAPYLAALLTYLEPLVSVITRITGWRNARYVSEIYDKEDLRELLDSQKFAVNNRIEVEDLERTLAALEFTDKKIKAHMVPRDKVHFVTPKDPIGPILLSELHKSGHSCFPVKGNSENEVVGMLHMSDIVDRTEGGVVSEAMNPDVMYVREDESLTQVAQAFVETRHYVFMVIDKDNKLTGLITVQDLLEQLLGEVIQDEFEEYGDRATVAGRSSE